MCFALDGAHYVPCRMCLVISLTRCQRSHCTIGNAHHGREQQARPPHIFSDTVYCNTPAGEVGPVARRLQGYDAVRGLVFGAWAECSPEVEKLLSWLARTGASRHWRLMGCIDEDAARGILAWSLRRRWSLTAMREAARLKLGRLMWTGSGASLAAQRRTSAQATWAARPMRRLWHRPPIDEYGKGAAVVWLHVGGLGCVHRRD